jgi:hypothetical protein
VVLILRTCVIRRATSWQIRKESMQRDVDKQRFGRAVLRSIRYGSCDGRLCEVTLTSKGSKNWRALKEETFRRFGSKVNVMPKDNPFENNPFAISQYYVWQGNISEMELVYESSSQVSQLRIGSVVARERMFQAVRKKKKTLPGDADGSSAVTSE